MIRFEGLQALGLVILVASWAPSAEAKDREANHFESAYSDLAYELPLPSLCEKISPRAYQTAARAPRGLQIFYTRSKCYFTLARRTRNSDYCRHVRQKRGGLRFLFGGKISEAACRNGRKGFVGGTPIDYEPILRILGYTDADFDHPVIKAASIFARSDNDSTSYPTSPSTHPWIRNGSHRRVSDVLAKKILVGTASRLDA